MQSGFFLGWSTQGGLFFGINLMKYIIYCRKSTESEDRQILSLPAQKRETKAFAKKNKLEVVDLLEESASAYKIGRPKFNEMIQRIQSGEADGIIVWSLTRIARNALDGGMIIHLMDTGILKEIRTPSGIIKNDGNDKFILQIEFAMSKKTSDDNSESVKRGNREKILRGWGYKKHSGYIFYEDEKYGWEKTLIPDTERFELIQKAIRLVLNRERVSVALNRLNNDWGFRTPKTRKLGGKPMSSGNFYKILHSEFYCGWLETSQGERILGKHQPMITEQEYDQLQVILADKGRPRPKSLDLPYRGMIFCGECGCTVCMEEKHQTICSVCKTKFASKNKHECINCHIPISKMKNPTCLHYIYGRCTKKKINVKCHQKSIKISDLEQQLNDFLSGIKLAPKTEGWVLKQLEKIAKQELGAKDQIRKNLQKNIDDAQAGLESLFTEFTSPANAKHELIEPEEYKIGKAKLKKDRKDAEKKLNDLGQQVDSFMTEIEKKFDFAVTARTEFESGNFQRQTEVIRGLGSNLILKDGKITVQQEYPWLFIKKANQELAVLKEKGLEPEKSIDIYEQTGAIDPVISVLQGGKESNSHQRFWRPLFYR